MKVRQTFFLDLCLFLIFFVVAAATMYKLVYTESGSNPSGGLVLISEVRPTGGVGKTNDEFVELYNPQGQAVVIGGWMINKMTKSASSTDWQQLFYFPVGAVLASHGHVLVAHMDSSVSSTADYLYTGQALSDDNSVVLLDNTGLIIDLVGYGLAKNSEAEPADAPNSQLFSIERKPGGNLGNGYDTNSNRLDFFRAESSPQNGYSPLVPLLTNPVLEITTSTESVTSTEPLVYTTSTITVSSTPAVPTSSLDVLIGSTPAIIQSTSSLVTSTPSTTVSKTFGATSTPQYSMGSILISELYPMPKSGEDEFVELFNRSSQNIDLTDWYISDGGGSKTSLSGFLPSFTHKVIEKPKGSLNNAGDLVNLIAPNEVVIDRVVYGDWNDGEVGNNAPAPQTGFSIVRIHETEDSNFDYFDFGLSNTTTKGLLNVYLPPIVEDLGEEGAEITTGVSSSSSNKTIVKKSEPLYIRIAYTTSAMVGDEIMLDASLSSGGEGVRQYLWEMDDGIILRGEMIKYVYKEAGIYSVAVTVFDDTGTEKHKTIKIKIISKPIVEVTQNNEKIKPAVVVAAKPSIKKADSVAIFTQISELARVKTNSLVRVRGVLAAVLITKTVPEFYFIGETAAGGTAVGVLVKTKNNSIDARVGDIVEITGKYIINTTSGNYIQYGVDDQLSVIGSGELLVPMNNTIKNITQLSGGYVQVAGEMVEKKTSYGVVSDSTGEIKVMGDLGEDVKIKNQVIIIGYIVRTKEGALIRMNGTNDITVKEVITTSTVLDGSKMFNKPERPIIASILIGLAGLLILCLVIKKFWFRKNKLIEATEI